MGDWAVRVNWRPKPIEKKTSDHPKLSGSSTTVNDVWPPSGYHMDCTGSTDSWTTSRETAQPLYGARLDSTSHLDYQQTQQDHCTGTPVTHQQSCGQLLPESWAPNPALWCWTTHIYLTWPRHTTAGWKWDVFQGNWTSLQTTCPNTEGSYPWNGHSIRTFSYGSWQHGTHWT